MATTWMVAIMPILAGQSTELSQSRYQLLKWSYGQLGHVTSLKHTAPLITDAQWGLDKIRIESDAILAILSRYSSGEWKLLGLSHLIVSIHVAAAEYSKADVFLSTDKNLLAAIQRMKLGIMTANPINWFIEVIENE